MDKQGPEEHIVKEFYKIYFYVGVPRSIHNQSIIEWSPLRIEKETITKQYLCNYS